jgi:hypothetical protein
VQSMYYVGPDVARSLPLERIWAERQCQSSGPSPSAEDGGVLSCGRSPTKIFLVVENENCNAA